MFLVGYVVGFVMCGSVAGECNLEPLSKTLYSSESECVVMRDRVRAARKNVSERIQCGKVMREPRSEKALPKEKSTFTPL